MRYFYLVGFFVLFLFIILKAVSFQMQKPLPEQPVFIKVTIPEGYSNKEIAERFGDFKNFNKENFLNIAEPKEGFLFPDTYFFAGFENEVDVVRKMEETFKEKVIPIFTQSDKNRESSISQSEIGSNISTSTIIMASILEKEARTLEDWKIISGILWKRMKVGMPLQVDAAPITYTQKGLPLAPIANPGLGAIEVAGNPVDSEYWYYLSDKEGVIHFSKTFDEHKIAKWKYLGY